MRKNVGQKSVDMGLRPDKNMGGWVVFHFMVFFILYDRASHWEPNAFYGIEKACSVVEIRHFECRENGLFL